jgi:hypothetical protein
MALVGFFVAPGSSLGLCPWSVCSKEKKKTELQHFVWPPVTLKQESSINFCSPGNTKLGYSAIMLVQGIQPLKQVANYNNLS